MRERGSRIRQDRNMALPDVAVPEPRCAFNLRMRDGAPIRVRQHGNPAGPRLVLSHGNGLATDAYLTFWGPLLNRYELVMFDFRNHGQNQFFSAERHNLLTFADDMEGVLGAIELRLGQKPTAGVFHSLSSLAAIKHALAHPQRWRALVLFDPPIHPHEGHPLQPLGMTAKHTLASRTRRRADRYKSPLEFATQLAARPEFRRWRPEAYGLLARATLRRDDASGDYTLACPRELEAQVFESRYPELWTDLARVKVPVKLICGDPTLADAGIPALVGRAIASEIPAIAYEAIADSTHFLQFERPKECIRAMESFLAEHGMAAPPAA